MESLDYHDALDDVLDALVSANWTNCRVIRLEASSLLLAVIIVLITSCLITPPCYELSMKERGENIIDVIKFLRREKRRGE